jgi:UV DNA damage repair endonuclease
MKIGFACKYVHPQRDLKPKQLKEIEQPLNCRATTVRWLNEHKQDAEDKLWELMQHNIQSIYELIGYVSTLPNELRMIRISSPILPVATEATWKYFWSKPDVIDYCEKNFIRCGNLARDKNVRLSMHPGQFTVLASDNPDIVERSIEEFEYHVNMARWMGYGKEFQDFKINVHISGRKGPQGIIDVMRRLTPEARNVLTIENDEMKWQLEHSLELEKTCALVLDIHHHWVATGEYIDANDDRVKRVIDSWRGKRPTLHYSVSREDVLVDHDPDTLPNMDKLLEQGYKKTKLRAHSDFYWNSAVNHWAWSFTDGFDIMCESKAKNLASIDFFNKQSWKFMPQQAVAS